jgi:hypothetical protein
VCEPEWFGSGKKDALIREFRNYLGILKAVHSGTDFCWAVLHSKLVPSQTTICCCGVVLALRSCCWPACCLATDFE